jgi:hypothetical protein
MPTERGSDKHGTRLDDQLAHDVRSMLQGSPVESRADESRQQEAPGDGDVAPDARLSGERGLTDPNVMLTDEEIEARSELARNLAGVSFPARVEDLVVGARQHHAPEDLVGRLSRLPIRSYSHTEAVWEALGGRTEPRG